MTNLILIYGDDPALLGKAALAQHEKHPDMQVQLRPASRFKGVQECAEVIVIGNFPAIAEAYEGKGVKITLRDDPHDEKPALKRSKKNKTEPEGKDHGNA